MAAMLWERLQARGLPRSLPREDVAIRPSLSRLKPLPRVARYSASLLLLFTALTCSIAWGADPSATPPAAASYSPAGQILKMIVGLVIVLIMIFVVAWLARNYMGFNPAQNATLKTVAGVLVGQKERVVLVQVGERQLLIGVAPGQISLLHVIEKGEEVTVAPPPPLSPFAEKLKRSLGRFEKS